MEDVVSSPIPILSFPDKVKMKVLQQMEINNQVAFSLCSKDTIPFVMPLNLKISACYIFVRTEIKVVCYLEKKHDAIMFVFYEEEAQNRTGVEPALQLTPPRSVFVRYFSGDNVVERHWKKPSFGWKDWIHHILKIFNHSKIDELHFGTRNESYNCDQLYEAFKEFKIMKVLVMDPCSDDYSQKILNNFFPWKTLYLHSNFIQNTIPYQKFLIRNLDNFNMRSPDERPISLDDLLMMNSSRANIYNLNFSEKYLNQFIKHWMNGANPRLERLNIRYPGGTVVLNKDIVLNGLDYQVMPTEQERLFNGFVESNRIRGGFDIHRSDGTKATILMNSNFDLYIWP